MLKNIKTTVAVTAGALALGLLGASPAVAAEHRGMPASAPAAEVAHPHHHYAKGKVVSRIGVNIRAKATTHSKVIGGLPRGAVVNLKCKVKGQNVAGNNIWYRLSDRQGWVAARYVKNLNHVRWC
ncbi:SH3 domain-containing protein [Streptomyces sp. ACA25]|uniref:SH3 domain-containing protein n=1 Tax=Streptomyces sp. ACA25 TaxID=3022596 RepID=UPI0023076EBF|nr:SH3 domain-containing protein [Streptomyces sp. ACA25]MDB1086388.1 SH3 domain-containing protein [Streptomyces sp. ACA25]